MTFGDKTVTLGPPSLVHQVMLILRFLLTPCVIFGKSISKLNFGPVTDITL